MAIVGPELDAEYGARVRAAMSERPWVRWVPHVDSLAMRAVYSAADVVLNTSVSEGLSNAVLEAMACARPMLVKAIPPNVELVEHGATGWVYRDELSFIAGVDAALRVGASEIGAAAQRFVRKHHSHEREGAALEMALWAAVWR